MSDQEEEVLVEEDEGNEQGEQEEEKAGYGGEEELDDTVLIFDLGSGVSKIGVGGQRRPKHVFNSVVGEPFGPLGKGLNWSVGAWVVTNKGFKTRLPTEWGVIRDWDAWEHLVNFSYDILSMKSIDYPVFLTEPHTNPIAAREKTIMVLFETFDVPYTYLASQVVLSLYASSHLTGLVVNIGEGTTDIIPYYEGRGQHLAHAALRHEISGRDMTEYMMMLLAREKNYQFFTRAERELIRDMKDNLSYIPLDYEAEMERMSYAHPSFYEQSYQLPNHQFIDVGKERYMAPEIMFKPFMADSKGIHEKIIDSIMMCDMNTHAELYSNIILSGGTTMIPGFPERLEKELKLLKPFAPIKVHALQDRNLLAWEGGSMTASLASFDPMWISKEEYDESGPSVVFKKCHMR